MQGHLHVPKTGGRAKLPMRAHLCTSMFLHGDRFWASYSLLEGQCLLHWPHSYIMLNWGPVSLTRFSRTRPSTTQESAIHKIGWMERVLYEILAPSWKRVEGTATPPAPSIGISG